MPLYKSFEKRYHTSFVLVCVCVCVSVGPLICVLRQFFILIVMRVPLAYVFFWLHLYYCVVFTRERWRFSYFSSVEIECVHLLRARTVFEWVVVDICYTNFTAAWIPISNMYPQETKWQCTFQFRISCAQHIQKQFFGNY